MFEIDQPITKCSDDLLGRSSFAETLAKAILKYESKECMVIGLYGSWGTGKTSIINMCVEYIKEKTANTDKDKKPIIIQFNPWNYSGRDQLILQFFNHITSTLSNDQPKGINKKIIKDINLYVKSILAIIKTINLGLFSIDIKYFKQKKSLEEKKKQISDSLKELPHKIIIIIDDIDRLNTNEIRQIFQLIKVLADLPNIIYIVSFDKEIVIKALEKEQEIPGEKYLEKIVQVPFEIPPVPEEKISKLLKNKINDIIKLPDEVMEKIDWDIFFSHGLKAFFNNIRDVIRYCNTLRFIFPLIEGEVHPLDFIVVTSFQVFFPELYYKIKENKYILCGYDKNFGDENTPKGEKERKLCKDILNLIPENKRDYIKKLLAFIFPNLKSIWGSSLLDSKDIITWRKNRRLYIPDSFDIYFRLDIPPTEISYEKIEKILSLENNPDNFKKELVRINEEGKLLKFLGYMDDFTDYIREKNIKIKNIISAFIDLLDLFAERKIKSDIFSLDSIIRIFLEICYNLSVQFKNKEVIFEIYKNALEKEDRNLYTAIIIIMNLEQIQKRQKRQEDESQEQKIINEEQINELKGIAVKKIETWANDGRLESQKYLYDIIFVWKRWGNKDNADKFIKDMINDDDKIIKLAEYASFSSIQIGQILPQSEIETFIKKIQEIRNSEKYNHLEKNQKRAIDNFLAIISLGALT